MRRAATEEYRKARGVGYTWCSAEEKWTRETTLRRERVPYVVALFRSISIHPGRKVPVRPKNGTRGPGFPLFIHLRLGYTRRQRGTMQSGLKTKLDYADYCAIPPDGKRYELIAGEVHVTAAPSPSHQRLVQRCLRILEDYFRSPMEVLISPIDVVLAPHDVLQPDLVVVADPAQVSDRGIEGAPLMIVEVLSPATAQFDRTTKAQRYAALGVPHYWLVDPASQQVECYRLSGGIYRSVAMGSAEATLSHPDFPDLQLPGPFIWR